MLVLPLWLIFYLRYTIFNSSYATFVTPSLDPVPWDRWMHASGSRMIFQINCVCVLTELRPVCISLRFQWHAFRGLFTMFDLFYPKTSLTDMDMGASAA